MRILPDGKVSLTVVESGTTGYGDITDMTDITITAVTTAVTTMATTMATTTVITVVVLLTSTTTYITDRNNLSLLLAVVVVDLDLLGLILEMNHPEGWKGIILVEIN